MESWLQIGSQGNHVNCVTADGRGSCVEMDGNCSQDSLHFHFAFAFLHGMQNLELGIQK
jgi:hypothetical protein